MTVGTATKHDKWLGLLALAGLLIVGLSACCPLRKRTKPEEVVEALTPTTAPPGEWLSLFDGKSLEGWKVTKDDAFALAGKIEIKDDSVILREGVPFTGITWEGEFPKENFEVAWEGRRVDGIDIFGGLTVPVGDAHITLVMGGWGDSVVGLSAIDGMLASDNQTCKIMSFKNNQWYKFRLRVTKDKIEAWIDDKPVVDFKPKGHKLTIHEDLHPNKPVGFFTWSTSGAVRNIDMRRLKADE